MTKLTISNSLLAAVKNAAVSMGDTFVLSVLPKEVGAGCRQASLSCCNGNAMSNIYLPVKADDDACGEYIFGKEFGQIVQTLSAYDEKDFVIKRKEDGTCTITCGSAVVPLPVRESAVKIQVKSPTDCGAVIVDVPAAELREAVARAGCAFSVSVGGRYEIVRNAMNVAIEKNGERYRLRFVTTDGVIASGARASITRQSGLEVLGDEGLSLSLNATVLTKIAGLIANETVTLFLAKGQVMLQDGYNVYTIVPNAQVFPPSVGLMLQVELQKAYAFKVSKKRFLASLDIAILNSCSEDTGTKACITVEDGTLSISSVDGSCRSKLETTEITGAATIGLNVSFVKKLLSHMAEDVTIYGAGPTECIFISDGMEGSRCFLAPAPISAPLAESNSVSEKKE